METKIAPTPDRSRQTFSVTKWFKRGELEAEMAKATAAAGSFDPLTGPSLPATVSDDPPLTKLDRRRLSLQVGGTPDTISDAPPLAVPGERMSDRETIAEGTRPFRARMMLGAGLGIVAVLAAVYLLVLR